MVTRRTAAAAGLATALFAALSFAGCGSGGPAVVPASGVVTFADGTPVPGAVVEFLPAGGGPAARGRTDEEGRFTLATGDRPGAIVGNHRVGVAQTVMMDGFAAHVRHMAEKQVVPPHFNSPATSGLVATVSAEGTNDVTLTIDEG